MTQPILAIDMGGTSVKAGLFINGIEVKNTRWEHDYKNCGLYSAKKDLSEKLHIFHDKAVGAIGLGVAGIVASDGSLYRSTVLTSFCGFHLPKFLGKEYQTEIVTIDNDADCGAISEYGEKKKEFFYVVVGSGIGSAYVDTHGNLPYRLRLNPQHVFSDKDNPIPNDLGLQVPIPKSYVHKIFQGYKVNAEIVDSFLVDKAGVALVGPNRDPDSIRVSKLGSAISLKPILEILLTSKESHIVTYWHKHVFKKGISAVIPRKDFLNEKRTATCLSKLARNKNSVALNVFSIFGHFLGYGIAQAQKIIRSSHAKKICPEVRLAGPIMRSYGYFKDSLIKALNKHGVQCSVVLANNIDANNVRGAYIQAKKAMEGQT